MTNQELVNAYLQVFIDGAPPSQLEPLLSCQLEFNGPLLQTNTSADYISCLSEGPIEKMNLEIVHTFENDQAVCVVYKVNKRTTSLLVTQVFEFQNQLISKIQTIFDASDFK